MRPILLRFGAKYCHLLKLESATASLVILLKVPRQVAMAEMPYQLFIRENGSVEDVGP